MESIGRAYARAGAAGRFTWFIEPGAGHVLSGKMWRKARETFGKYLA